ncbi:MAG: hypothetical protein HY650_05450 [Acidobacteria bacterium]|nr:hypothetical protein [Acidobacteriota bacterium]
MATQNERQNFSLKGIIGIAVLLGIAYILIQSESLLTLYTLVTVLLVAVLIVVGFDIGLKRASVASVEGLTPSIPEPVPAPPPASKPVVKKRRR